MTGRARRSARDAGALRSARRPARGRGRRGGARADRPGRRRRARVVRRRHGAVRGGDPRRVGADSKAGRAAAPARAREPCRRRRGAPPAGRQAPPAPSSAPSSPQATVSIFSQRSPAVERSARERAVEMFDRGVALRGGGRYGEALDSWEKALALAPDNRIYQANVQRLRERSRSAACPDARRSTSPARCASSARRWVRRRRVGLYRLLRLVAFDTMTGSEAVAAAQAAGEKIGRSLGVGKLDDFVALCATLKVGVVDASVVSESSVRVVVRECIACAGAHTLVGVRRCATSRVGWSPARSPRSSGGRCGCARPPASAAAATTPAASTSTLLRSRARARPRPAGLLRLSGQRALRGRAPSLALQPAQVRPAPPRRRRARACAVPGRSRSRARRSAGCVQLVRPGARRFQGNAGAARLRQPDRDRLLGRAGAVLALTDVLDLLVHERARRGRRALSPPQLLLGLLDGCSVSA